MPKKKPGEPPKFNVTQLAELFGIDRGTVSRKLKKVAHQGRDRRGIAVYTVKAAAPWLVDMEDIRRVEFDPEAEIDPDKLPPDMAKDYWDAQLKQQKFQRNEGDLWDTLEVMNALSEVFKALVNPVRTLVDAIEDRGGLTPKQVEVIQEVVDSALLEAHQNVVEYAGSLSESV